MLAPVSPTQIPVRNPKGRIVGNDFLGDFDRLIELTIVHVRIGLRESHDWRQGIELRGAFGFIDRFLRAPTDGCEVYRKPLVRGGVAGIKRKCSSEFGF